MNTDYSLVRKDGRRFFAHRELAAKALGRKLKISEEIHHVDGNKKNNGKGNLVVCDRAYHFLIEARTRALKACGNPNWLKCRHCNVWDDPANLYVKPGKREARHRQCHARAEQARKHDR